MKSIRFYLNPQKPDATHQRARLMAKAVALGFVERTAGEADVILALGGDGTILRAVHEFRDTPVLGFNLGGLGYLASVGEADAERALEMLAAGQYVISERTLLEANGTYAALNDIVVSGDSGGHSTRLDLEADGKLVTRYMADGLIVATPTGSTAYSLAAGGPVVMADSPSFVVTPLNPHALGVRPLVVNDDVCLKVTACARTDGNRMTLGVYADGAHVMSLAEGESVRIAKSRKTARLVELQGYDPYEVLARKLGWRGSNIK